MKLVIMVFNAEMKERSPFLSLEVLQPPFVVYLLLLWKSPPPHCGRHARFSAIPFRVSVMKTNRKRGLLVLTAHKQHQNNLHMLFFFQEALLLSYLK